MSHALIGDLKKKATPVNQARTALSVSRSGYYSAANAGVAAPKVCADSGSTYGSSRLCTALQLRGITIARHQVRSLMRAHKLRAVWRGKFIHTTDSKHAMPVSSNVLDRQFARALPNQVWVSDITYIRTRSGWLYLAAVLELHSRKIVGWAMAPAMPAALVCGALQMTICATQSSTWIDSAFRPGDARCIRSLVQGQLFAAQHEPSWKLLGQCGCRVVL